MVKGLDELVDFAVERIALCGTQGANAYEVKTIVGDFYDDAASEVAPNVDDRFCGKVWSWLCKHSDIRVRVRELADATVVAPGDLPAGSNGSAAPGNVTEHYLTVKTTRMWHTLAGHGPDHKRIPPMSFVVLSIIASHGAAGVLQPDITSISGQDKRSVPKRTDDLARSGYIEKRTVLAKGTHKTSLCTLNRFVEKAADAERDDDPANPAELLELAFKDSVVRHEAFIQSAIPLIKAAEVITLNDMKRHYNILGRRWESRVLSDFILRMEVMGLVEKLRAKIDGFEDTKHTLRSVQFVREPTAAEIQTFCALGRLDSPARRERFENAFSNKTAGTIAEENDDEETFDGEPDEDQRREILGDLAQRRENTQPIDWTPMLSVNQNIYNVIKSAGSAGLSTMALIDRLGGPFYRRPIEHMTAQMTDSWEGAQPDYLRHLSIIRDVGQSARFTYYIYRTLEHFDQATKLGYTTWEAVQSSAESQAVKQAPKWIKNMPLDKWGFPQIRTDLLLRDGYASAADARRALEIIRQPVRILGDMAAFGRGGKGRVQRAERTPTVKGHSSKSTVEKMPSTGSPVTPSRGRGRPPKQRTNRLSELRATIQDDISQADVSPMQNTSRDDKVSNGRGSSTRVTRLPEEPTPAPARGSSLSDQETEGEPSTPVQYLDESDDSRPARSLQPRGIPSRRQAIFNEQMQKVADRIARKELGIPMDQPLASRQIDNESPETLRDETSATTAVSSKQPTTTEAANINNKRTLSPTDAETEATSKRLKLEHREPEPVSDTTLWTYRRRVKALTQDLVNLQEPGVYINPPKYLAWKRGRPRSAALVVVKSNRLRTLPWFELSHEPTTEIYLGPGVDPRTRKIDRQIQADVDEDERSRNMSTRFDSVSDSAAQTPVPGLVATDRGDESHSRAAQKSDLASVHATFGIRSPTPALRNGVRHNSLALAGARFATPMSPKEAREKKDLHVSQAKPRKRTRSIGTESGQVDSTGITADSDQLELQASGDDEVLETPADLSWIELSRTSASTSLGRAISSLMSPRRNSRKRRKLDEPSLQARPSLVEPSTTGGSNHKSIIGASRNTIASPIPAPPLPMMKAKQFIALIDPGLTIPYNPKFEGMERQQPYGCVQCGRRYRNPGGLEYHVDNSEPCYPERYAEAQRMKAQKAQAGQGRRTNREQNIYQARPESENSLASEDEAEPLSMDGKDDAEDKPPDPPFAPLIRGQINTSHTQPEQAEEPTQSPTKTRKDPRAKTGTMLGGGSVMHKRYEIVLDLLKRYNGAIPGDRALHSVFITAWRNGGGAGSPDIDTLRRTINNLISQLKIKRLFLAFNAGGLSHNANILTLPDIAPNSAPVLNTLQLFKDAYPRMPIPPDFEIAEDLKRGIQSFPGYAGLSGRADRYPANNEVTVKRLRQPLLPTTQSTGQAPAWAKWAELNTVPSKGGRAGTLYTRDDFLEATLDDIEDGVRLPSGHIKVQVRNKQGPFRRRQGGDTMHTRIQWAKQARREELVDDLDEIAALEAQVSKEQAGMQSVFSLGGDYVPSRFEPGQIAISGGRGQSGPRPRGGGIRWKPFIREAASNTFPLSEDTIAEEDLADDIPEEDAPEMTMPRLGHVQRNRSGHLVFPVLRPAMPMVDLTVSPMGWVTGLRLDGGTKPAQGVAAGPASLIPVNVDRRALLTTFTDPDQTFYDNSGTFSTDFAVRRKLKPQLRIPTPRQTEYEARMAAAFNELEPDWQAMGKLQAGFHDIEEVERWESSHREDLTASMELIQTRWINHTVNPDIAANVTWVVGNDVGSNFDQPVELGDTGPLRRNRRSKILRRPPIRPRKVPPSEPKPPQEAWNKGMIKRKSKKPRQTRRDYAIEHGHAEPNPMLEGGKRGPQTKRYLKKEQLERALAAIVLAQVLAGGKSHTLDWRVVESALDDKTFDLKFLRHRWFTIRSQNSIRLAELRGKFQKNFIRAASRGEVEIPDFDHAADYNWNQLHRWTMENVVDDHRRKANSTALDPLPATRTEFDQECSLADDELYIFPNQDQYKPLGTIQRREELMIECDWTWPLHKHHQPTIDEISLTAKAESWLRSNVLAKGQGYDAQNSRALLEQLPGPILDQALTTYLDRKWLRVLNKGRLGPGRNYVAHTDFVKLLRPEARDKDICQPGVGFKLALDEQLAVHEQFVSSLHSQRGESVTLLNLVAAQRVEFAPVLPPTTHDTDPIQFDARTGTEQKCLSVYGLAPGNYVTKNLAKDEFYFDVCVRPTPAYITGVDPIAIDSDAAPPIPAPHLDPVSGQMRLDRASPIWYDLQGRLNVDVWKQLVMCVVLELVCQAGKSAEDMARRYDGAIAAWEMDCVLGWLAEVGAAKRMVRRDGSLGGWTAAQGKWWYVFGAGSGDDDDDDDEDDRGGAGGEDDDEDEIEDDDDEDEDEGEQARETPERAKETRRVSFALPDDDESANEVL